MAAHRAEVEVDVTAKVSAKLADVLRERLVATEREATDLRVTIAKLEQLAGIAHQDVPPAQFVHRGRGAWVKNAELRERAFRHFVELGEYRTIRQVGRDLGIPEDTVTGWSRRENWLKRVAKSPPPTPRVGPIPVETALSERGGRRSREAAVVTLDAEEVLEELTVALGELGPLTDRGFLEHRRAQGLFPSASDASIALAFANAVHDQPKLFRRRHGVVELVQ